MLNTLERSVKTEKLVKCKFTSKFSASPHTEKLTPSSKESHGGSDTGILPGIIGNPHGIISYAFLEVEFHLLPFMLLQSTELFLFHHCSL
jgi:hypothetical protein